MTFPIKVMGAVESNLEAIVIPILRKNKVDIERAQIEEKLSKGGKYNSITVTFIAESKEQLDEIYRELSANPLVLMVL
jgi:putative lipoic acid-binding regulatory protein